MKHDRKFDPSASILGPAIEIEEPPKASAKGLWISLVVVAVLVIGGITAYRYWADPVGDWIDTRTGGFQSERLTDQNAIPKPTEQQLKLLELTRGESDESVLKGEQAQAANLALPFSNRTTSAARGFVLAAGNAASQNRAQTCLTQAVYYEAGFEPSAGKKAVAQVVLNRMRHPAFPSSVCGVVYQGYNERVCQFSFTCDGSLHRAPEPAAWKASQKIAAAALSGAVQSDIGHSTHYHADYVSPYWAPKLAKIKKLGVHIFYAWPGAWGQRTAFTNRYIGREYLPSLEQIRLADVAPEISDVPNYAETGLSVAPHPTDRHSETDVGGRLDVNKGWTLKIPDPSETRSAFGKLAAAQADETAAATPEPVGGE